MASLLAAAALAIQNPVRFVFPRDPATVIDVKRDLGAKGDGKTDDTDALQKGIDLSSGLNQKNTKALFLPRGVYRVTRSLMVGNSIGPWVYGEDRDRTIIRLDDGAKGVTAVIRSHPSETEAGSADWFMRNFRGFTIDAGNNPEADGIRFFSNNTGILKDVVVRGNGKVGVNSGFLGQAGPSLVQDVRIQGFEVGVKSEWIWGQTLSRVVIEDARKTGVSINGHTVAIEDLTVKRAPLAIHVKLPNDWYWWSGVAAVINSSFAASAPDGPAILNEGVLYARNVKASGFGRVLESRTPVGSKDGSLLAEYFSHPVRKAFDAPDSGLGLPIKQEPRVAWETNPAKWLCANDFGVTVGDSSDDTAAIQKALDAAAAQGRTFVYFRGTGGPDPNWVLMEGTVKVKAPVRQIMGLGWARLMGKGKFVVDDASAPFTKFQNIDSFGGPPVGVENAAQSKVMVVESCGVRVLGTGKGDIFVTDMPGGIFLTSPGQKAWARHLNPEGTSDSGLVANSGGDLWVLGVKHEGVGVRFRTEKGGRTEVFGVFNYLAGVPEGDRRAAFEVQDGQLSVAGWREISFAGPTSGVKVRETRKGEVGEANAVPGEHGWIGWALYRSG